MAKTVCVGDSFTYGFGLKKDELPWCKILFPDCINLGEPGSSNQSIARRAIEYSITHKNRIDAIWILWSAIDRIELSDTVGHEKTFLLNYPKTPFEKLYIQNHYNEISVLKNFLLLANHLADFCYVNDIELVYSNYLPVHKIEVLSDYKNFKDNFDLSLWSDSELRRFHLTLNRLYQRVADKFITDPSQKIRVECDEIYSFHPTDEGHRQLAKLLSESYANKNTSSQAASASAQSR